MPSAAIGDGFSERLVVGEDLTLLASQNLAPIPRSPCMCNDLISESKEIAMTYVTGSHHVTLSVGHAQEDVDFH